MRIKHLVRHFLQCRNGNFGILTAGSVACLAATAGVAVDVNRMIDLKSQLQAAADAGALAGVSAMAQKGAGVSTAEKVASDFTREQIKQLGVTSEVTVTAPKVVADAVTKPLAGGQLQYEVTVSASRAFEVSGLTRLLGVGAREVSVTASAVNDGQSNAMQAISLFLVLDTSDSMGNSGGEKAERSKLQALQGSLRDLIDVLAKSKLQNTYFRTGAASFNDVVHIHSQLAFQLSNLHTVADRLKLEHGTNSHPAMKLAVEQLLSPSDNEAHRAQNGQSNPAKYIVFMGDGINTVPTGNDETQKLCNQAKAAGVTIMSVEFGGKRDGWNRGVLDSCASPGMFWEAEERDQLEDRFRRIGALVQEPKAGGGSRLKS